MSKIVHRTLDFFETFAAQKTPLSLTDLTRILDLPASSCHDVVHTLEERGYVYEVRPRGGFYPTARLFNMAKEIVDNDPIVQRAQPELQRICDDFKVSAWLGKIKSHQVTYIVVCRSDDPLSYNVSVGETTRSLYATSSGKALLAGLPVDERKKVVAGLTLKPFTPATLTSKPALLKEIEMSEERGWFTNREESVDDSLSISVRFEWNGSSYTITIAGSVKRVDRNFAKILKAGLSAANVLGNQANP